MVNYHGIFITLAQVAPCFPDVFGNFYLENNLKIANNSTTAEAGEKNCTDLKSL
jgi:hypothetical protein